MSDEHQVSLSPRQIIGGLIAFALLVLFVIELGRASRRPADSPETQARNAEALQALLGGGPRILSRDANPLNKSTGQAARLRQDATEWLVTPSKAGPGAAAPCATGSHVTVDLTVETVDGADPLPLNAFLLLTPAGPAAPVVACSTGFGGGAARRTLVFAADDYDQLIVGTDPAAPVVSWQLS
ncbi:hypothetical protein [Actinoplanes sp. CA-252034]|uniref:hypothetical protein n=1 Tax=Actinoplanes sp. CA-252034 TaxID=3239906 RepID=UPI003D97223C